jgi:ABC-type transport system involved in multi-copper enzyme maturation permease subunit
MDEDLPLPENIELPSVSKAGLIEAGVVEIPTGEQVVVPNPAELEAEATPGADLTHLGQTRMEAAFGSGDGDEDATALVAQPAAQVSAGTIFDQVYRPWRGELGPRWMRNWAILRHHVYGLFTSKGHRRYHPFVRLTIFGIALSSLAGIGFAFIGSITGAEELQRVFGLSRGNIYGKVLGFWPRNICWWPLITALIVGGMISDDRQNGTSALYFSRPINRIDYTAMKFASVAIILGGIILLSYVGFYAGGIVMEGEGWSYIIDTLPILLSGFAVIALLVFTYTAIGLALSSVSKGRFFPAVSFLGIILGTKLVAFLVDQLFERSVIYVISPYDNLAHIGQWLMGIDSGYEHPVSFSIISLVAINAAALYLLTARVNSLEVTRE